MAFLQFMNTASQTGQNSWLITQFMTIPTVNTFRNHFQMGWKGTVLNPYFPDVVLDCDTHCTFTYMQTVHRRKRTSSQVLGSNFPWRKENIWGLPFSSQIFYITAMSWKMKCFSSKQWWAFFVIWQGSVAISGGQVEEILNLSFLFYYIWERRAVAILLSSYRTLLLLCRTICLCGGKEVLYNSMSLFLSFLIFFFYRVF